MAKFHYPPVDLRVLRSGCYLTSVGALTYQPGQSYPVAGHPREFALHWSSGRTLTDFALVMIVEGAGDWESPRGERARVTAGDLFYLVPGGWHRYRPAGDRGWTEKWCCLTGEIVHRMIDANLLPRRCRRVPGGVKKETEKRLDRLRQDILREPGENHPSWGLRALSLLLESLGDRPRVGHPSQVHPVVETAVRFIRENLHRPLQVTDVATHCRVERRTLERAFSRHSLGPIGQFLVRERILRAEMLLRDTELSIKEVAFASGFGGTSRMIYDFRRHRQTTPGAFRRQVRE